MIGYFQVELVSPLSTGNVGSVAESFHRAFEAPGFARQFDSKQLNLVIFREVVT